MAPHKRDELLDSAIEKWVVSNERALELHVEGIVATSPSKSLSLRTSRTMICCPRERARRPRRPRCRILPHWGLLGFTIYPIRTACRHELAQQPSISLVHEHRREQRYTAVKLPPGFVEACHAGQGGTGSVPLTKTTGDSRYRSFAERQRRQEAPGEQHGPVDVE